MGYHGEASPPRLELAEYAGEFFCSGDHLPQQDVLEVVRQLIEPAAAAQGCDHVARGLPDRHRDATVSLIQLAAVYGVASVSDGLPGIRVVSNQTVDC